MAAPTEVVTEAKKATRREAAIEATQSEASVVTIETAPSVATIIKAAPSKVTTIESNKRVQPEVAARIAALEQGLSRAGTPKKKGIGSGIAARIAALKDKGVGCEVGRGPMWPIHRSRSKDREGGRFPMSPAIDLKVRVVHVCTCPLFVVEGVALSGGDATPLAGTGTPGGFIRRFFSSLDSAKVATVGDKWTSGGHEDGGQFGSPAKAGGGGAVDRNAGGGGGGAVNDVAMMTPLTHPQPQHHHHAVATPETMMAAAAAAGTPSSIAPYYSSPDVGGRPAGYRPHAAERTISGNSNVLGSGEVTLPMVYSDNDDSDGGAHGGGGGGHYGNYSLAAMYGGMAAAVAAGAMYHLRHDSGTLADTEGGFEEEGGGIGGGVAKSRSLGDAGGLEAEGASAAVATGKGAGGGGDRGLAETATKEEPEGHFKVYWQWWLMLLYMSILNLLSDWTCYSVAPIVVLTSEAFGSIDPESLVVVFLGANAVATACEPIILSRLGLRRTILFGALLLMIRSCISAKLVTLKSHRGSW